MSQPQLTTLPNGLRIVTDRMESLQTAAIGIWANVGARHETAEQGGIAHLWEHMAFKGTPARNAFDIAAAIENVGGQLNAYTGREVTGYYARVLEQDVPLALDIIGDILLNSLLDESELVKERAVVIQEIGQANDTPDDIIYDHLQAMSFPDQPLGRPILGTVQSVNAIMPDDIRAFIKRTYHAGSLAISAAGAVDHDAIVRQCETLFGHLQSAPPALATPATYAGGAYREDRVLDQTHILIGFNGVSLHDPDYYNSQIYAMAMGGGMSSRLFQEVREKRGLVYSIHSFHSGFDDNGLFAVYAGTGPDELQDMIPVIMDEMRKSADALPPAELNRARAQVKAQFLMSSEKCFARAELWASQLLTYGHLKPIAGILAQLDAATQADLSRVAANILSSSPSVIALGPVETLEPYAETVARLAT